MLKIEHLVTCLATVAYMSMHVHAAVQYMLLFVVLVVYSDQFQILWSNTLLLKPPILCLL